MGADRKGPLVAFIVIAIIAAILLITSVRSQAATGRPGRTLPSTPEVVDRIGGGTDHVLVQGAVLVRRTPGRGSPSPQLVRQPPAARRHPGPGPGRSCR